MVSGKQTVLLFDRPKEVVMYFEQIVVLMICIGQCCGSFGDGQCRLEPCHDAGNELPAIQVAFASFCQADHFSDLC